MFLLNSRRARSLTPCLTLKECEDLAVEVLRKNRRPSNFPAMRDFASSNGLVGPGQSSTANIPYRIPTLTRAQKAILKSQQQQLSLLNPGALAAPAGTTPVPQPLVKSKAQRVAGGLQVCPAFCRQTPCPRGGDSKGKCLSKDNTILHHICSICTSSAHGRVGHK